MNGYSGKVLWVDLTNKEFKVEDTEQYREWIGGRSLGAYILSKLPELYSDNRVDQPIAISAGVFTGSDYPLSTRTAVTARNQLSNGFCFSNVGGDFGTRLRRAGYDAVVVQGHSQDPVYVLITEDGLKFIAADDMWGMRISDFRQTLFDKHGKENLSYIGIGPAGENQVEISCLMVDRAHAAGWGGSGSIFGAKKLKALVAIGDTPVEFFDPTGVKEKADRLSWRVSSSEAMAVLVRGGTHGSAGAGGFNGQVSTAVNNIQDEFLSPEESAPIRENNFQQWELTRDGCLDCQINCMHDYEIDSEEYGKMTGVGMHANTVRGLGSNLGLNEPHGLFKMHVTCNELGLDVDGVAACIGYALESAEKGILEREQPGGVNLQWGAGKSLVKLTEQIAAREGLGALLSQGVYEAGRQIGKGSEAWALSSKKVGINEQGLRSHRAWALGFMTSTRGGGHLGGSPQTENRQISPEIGAKLFGNPKAGIPQAYEGKGKLVAMTAVIKVIVDSLGLCYFTYGWYDLSIGSIDELAEMYYLATGIKLSGKELYQKGLRIHALERYLSYRLGGFSRKDDTLPDRFFDTEVKAGPHKGAHLHRDKVEEALDEYFKTLEWDVETGLPTEQNLKDLDIAYLIQ